MNIEYGWMSRWFRYGVRFGAMAVLGVTVVSGDVPLVLHQDLQAVDAAGVSSWDGDVPFRMRGVLLNAPEEMLDGEWDADAVANGVMGAQWQIFFQAVDPGDRGGTACWMGQNYNSLGPWIPPGNAYSEAEWSNQIQRVQFDGTHSFQPGDLIEVTARRSLFFGGKRNINEAHGTDPERNFDLELVQAGYGLPEPEVIRLADVVSAGRDQIFDETRQSGGEYYQGMRVRIEGIRLATNDFGSSGWGETAWADRRCTVTDGEGRYFDLRMPLTDLGPPPTDWFSAVGIFNQESGSGTDGTSGYELFVQEIGPRLRMMSQSGMQVMAWPATYSNYVLQATSDLSDPDSWEPVTTAPVQWIVVEEEVGSEPRFYRLVNE